MSPCSILSCFNLVHGSEIVGPDRPSPRPRPRPRFELKRLTGTHSPSAPAVFSPMEHQVIAARLNGRAFHPQRWPRRPSISAHSLLMAIIRLRNGANAGSTLFATVRYRQTDQNVSYCATVFITTINARHPEWISRLRAADCSVIHHNAFGGAEGRKEKCAQTARVSKAGFIDVILS